MLANKKKPITLKQKLKACGFVLKSMRYVLQEGDLGKIIIEVLIHKDLMLSLDMLDSGCLCEVFALLFLCPQVQDALEREMKQNPLIVQDVDMILKNRWETSVDFLEGVLHIFRIKDILELESQSTTEQESTELAVDTLNEQSNIRDSPKIMYTEFSSYIYCKFRAI